jgi:hypothetical protein
MDKRVNSLSRVLSCSVFQCSLKGGLNGEDEYMSKSGSSVARAVNMESRGRERRFWSKHIVAQGKARFKDECNAVSKLLFKQWTCRNEL